MAPNRVKDLPPKCNYVALYGAAFPFLLFLFCLIYWHLAFFVLNRLAPCLFFLFWILSLWRTTKLAVTEPRQSFQNMAGGRNKEGKNGEKSGVVVVDRNDGENNGDEHKVTSNY